MLRTGGEMAPGLPNVAGTRAVDQSDREIAQGGENLGGVAGAQAGVIFAKGHVAHRMGTVFDAPMSAAQVEQALGTGFARR